MILIVLRDSKRDVFVCSDTDYDIAEQLVDTLAEHAVTVLSSLPTEVELINGAGVSLEKFLTQILVSPFETKIIRTELVKHGVSKRTVFRLITQMVEKGYIRKMRLGWLQIID